MVISFISVIIFSGSIILVRNRRFPSFFEEKSDYLNALYFGAVICKAKAFKIRRNRMTKDPITVFWENIEFGLDESSFKYIIDDLIVKVRK